MNTAFGIANLILFLSDTAPGKHMFASWVWLCWNQTT